MTNAEKYLKDGVDKKEFATAIAKRQTWWSSDAQEHFAGIVNDLIMFFDEEAQCTLTKEEKIILKNINYTFNAIKRNDYGFLELYDICLGEWKECQFRDDLFRFIKEREEYLIEELLKND